MFAKFRKAALMIGAVLALVMLAGCTGTMNGGGPVTLYSVQTGSGNEVTPTEAAIAVSATCNDHKDLFRATVHLTDNDNGVNFTARLPWVPVANITEGEISTCEDAAAFVEEYGVSLAVGLINSQGQESGEVEIAVSEPGLTPECDDLQALEIYAVGTEDVLPGGYYYAKGCLDHGKITFH